MIDRTVDRSEPLNLNRSGSKVLAGGRDFDKGIAWMFEQGFSAGGVRSEPGLQVFDAASWLSACRLMLLDAAASAPLAPRGDMPGGPRRARSELTQGPGHRREHEGPAVHHGLVARDRQAFHEQRA